MLLVRNKDYAESSGKNLKDGVNLCALCEPCGEYYQNQIGYVIPII
jgi:hypothetical protein